VIRVYDFDEEVHYVVRRADGTPIAVPSWMTRPDASYAKIVSAARLPVRVILELHRATVTCLSTRVHNVHQEDHDAAAPIKTSTATVRRNASPSRHTISTGCATAATPGTGAVDAVVGQEDPERGRP
jgi:hypothetical protein